MIGGLMSCTYLIVRFVNERTSASRCRPGGHRAIHGLGGLLSHESVPIAAGEPMPYALAVLGGALCLIFSEGIECSSAISCSF
jgi:hypothetical protein